MIIPLLIEIGFIMSRKATLDLTGKVFGRLKVYSKALTKDSHGGIYWSCLCECGNALNVRASSVTMGKSKSCGCYHKDKITTHGMTGTPTFKSWDSMKQRCTNPNSPDYVRYGERGIKVCNRWLNSFDNFLSDMGERPKGKTLDRIDNKGDYVPENCRWATTLEQLSNRSNTIKIMYDGSLKTIRELGVISGMKEKIIRDRLYAGWDIEKILSTPNRKKIISS